MATKDYAKQGRPQPRRNPQQQPAPSGPRPRLWFILTTVLLAIGGFGYFLYTINGAGDNATEVPASKPARPQPKTTSLPPKPQPKWQYEKELKDKEVVVDVPAQPESTREYRLQCGSFRTQKQAEALKARIAFQGFESTMKQVKGSSGLWYQVSLGPFANKRQAETSRHKLTRQAKINTCKIYFWQ